MKQQKEIAYQLDLFTEGEKEAILHSESCEAGSGAAAGKGQQVTTAQKQTRALTDDLMRIICSKDNLRRAYKQVKRNDGSSGIDGITIKEFKEWYPSHETELIESLMQGTYRPEAVRGVEIDKPGGGKRLLGIPTVKDRFIQQAIHQVMNDIYDDGFSDSSYGFREGRNAHQALRKASEYVQDGNTIVIDIDLEKFFDKVNHDRLMYQLSQRIGDKTLLRLIRQYLQSGIMLGGLISQRVEGTPQGSPLSPLLSNIVLDELDRELKKRGHKFCRYADDCNIYVRTKIAGERVMESISRFIEEKLKLKVNRSKSKVCPVWETKFLGYRLLSEGILVISPQNLKRFKDKIRQITHRNRGRGLPQIIGELNNLLRGWLNYFRYASMKKELERLDGWIRRRIRSIRLKQCKRTYTIVKFLKKSGIDKKQSWLVALSGKGWWRLSDTPQLHQAMNVNWFDKQGLFNLSLNYLKLKN
jgi:group II intron reverse transcriptase/maturase